MTNGDREEMTSSSPSASSSLLRVGGALDPTQDLYIKRPQDDELFEFLVSGEYCNLLTSRQMGKSSAMRYASHRLFDAGVQVAEIDLAGNLGSNVDIDQWYCGFLEHIARELEVREKVRPWWDERGKKAPNQRLQEFFRDVIVPAVDAPIVIFVDEIDAVLKLDFTDDFFTGIRAMYNQRSTTPAYDKITFCLIGVAQPNELIRDKGVTPYNIGELIELRDFERDDDLALLAALLEGKEDSGERLLRAILKWTDGHPFLTTSVSQKCQRSEDCQTAADLDAMLESTYRNMESVRNDAHFTAITRKLDKSGGLAELSLYRKIFQGEQVADSLDEVKACLKLSGLVKSDGRGHLVVRNPIYRRIFDREWIAEKLAPYRKTRMQIAAAIVLVVMVLAGGGVLAYDHFIAEPRLHQAKAEESIKVLKTTRDESTARQAYTRLSGRTSEALTGYEEQAETLYREFWIRRGSEFSRAAEALIDDGEIDKGLLMAALASVKTGEPIDERFQRIYRERGYRHLVATLRGHRAGVVGSAFSSDGGYLVTASEDKTLMVWDARTYERRGHHKTSLDGQPGYRIAGMSSAVVAGQVTLLTWSEKGRIDRWQLEGPASEDAPRIGEVLRHQVKYAIPVESHDMLQYAALHPGGQRLLTTGQEARVWDATAEGIGALRGSAARHVVQGTFSPDGERVALASYQKTAQVWSSDLQDGPRPAIVHSLDVDRVIAVWFHPDGSSLWTAGHDGLVKLWRLDAPEEPTRVYGHTIRDPADPRSMQVIKDLTWVDICSDGKRIAVGARHGNAGYVAVWDASREPVQVLDSKSPVWHVAFSPDCRLIAVSQDDGLVRVWQADQRMDSVAPATLDARQRWDVWQVQLGLTASEPDNMKAR